MQRNPAKILSDWLGADPVNPVLAGALVLVALSVVISRLT